MYIFCLTTKSTKKYCQDKNTEKKTSYEVSKTYLTTNMFILNLEGYTIENNITHQHLSIDKSRKKM